MKLSIIIATHNNPALCKQSLLSLLPIRSKQVEILIIDNGANTQSTKVILPTSFSSQHIHYHHTKIVGLAHARNLGWKKAKGEYVAFIDDDAVASSSWIKNILAFIKKHPSVIAFGGPYISSNQDLIPSWIPAEVTSKILMGKQARKINLGHEWLNGTNMIFACSILKKLGGFDESLGITGSKRGYGEETDLQIRIHNAGQEIWYDPKIKVEHLFADFKQNLWYLLKNQFTHGKNSQAIFSDFTVSTQSRTASTAWSRLTQKNIPIITRIYYLLSPLCYFAGSLTAKFTS